jgi:uncharacterized SAM-binding protein YcdF (DUF218 family)
MFFIASKALWFFAAPSALLILGALIGAAYSARRSGQLLALGCLAILLVIGAAPAGALLIAPLENRFPAPPADAPPPYGVIVLGGAIDEDISMARGQTTFDEGAERLTQAAILARRYPSARIVYTGGSNSLLGRPSTEAEQARNLLVAMGVDAERITLETRSRNTDENARFTAAIVHPQSDQSWFIVTSAFHMPRAMGLFRKAGFAAIADPVDYRTVDGRDDWRLNVNLPHGLVLFDLAVHEWIGLFAYRLSHRIDDFFPGP